MKTNALLFFALLMTSCVNKIDTKITSINHSDKIFQYSTKNGLLRNNYIGDLTVSEIKKSGDFGLGTFNMVDGEMVISNGNVYQVLTDGRINNMPSETLSPFVVTKFFNADTTFKLIGTYSLDSLKTSLSKMISSPTAVNIKANFKSLKSRSVDKVNDLSTTLEEIVAKQTIFNFSNVDGNIIGFWYPEYFDGVNFTGFHLHVLLNDLSGGGHLLDCSIENPTIELDFAPGVNVSLNLMTLK